MEPDPRGNTYKFTQDEIVRPRIHVLNTSPSPVLDVWVRCGLNPKRRKEVEAWEAKHVGDFRPGASALYTSTISYPLGDEKKGHGLAPAEEVKRSFDVFRPSFCQNQRNIL